MIYYKNPGIRAFKRKGSYESFLRHLFLLAIIFLFLFYQSIIKITNYRSLLKIIHTGGKTRSNLLGAIQKKPIDTLNWFCPKFTLFKRGKSLNNLEYIKVINDQSDFYNS